MNINSSLLQKYFPHLTAPQEQLFEQFSQLFLEFNQQVNLISRKDTEHLVERHILHSLSLSLRTQFAPKQTVVDIGTGGGFPGLPLAILHPETNFILVDSIGKKIKVVQSIAQTLNLTNVTAINDRLENLKTTPSFYVTRAVSSLTNLKTWIKQSHKNSKASSSAQLPPIYALKGGDLTAEIQEFQHKFKTKPQLTPLSNYFTEEFFETKVIIKF